MKQKENRGHTEGLGHTKMSHIINGSIVHDPNNMCKLLIKLSGANVITMLMSEAE